MAQGSPAWQRRNARAQALGFRNYYDYRAHNYGRRPASAPAARGPELARLRGHRGPRDLDRALARGDVELMNVIQTSSDPPEFEVLVTRADGSTATYTVKGRAAIGRLNQQIDALGPAGPKIVGSPPQRRALRGTGLDRDDEELLAEEEQRAEEEALAEELGEELGVDPADVLDAIDEALGNDDDIPF